MIYKRILWYFYINIFRTFSSRPADAFSAEVTDGERNRSSGSRFPVHLWTITRYRLSVYRIFAFGRSAYRNRSVSLNTTQLECFLAVANYLNFSRAAEHLKITQPAVSHQIGTLEDELETKLFHRTSKSVRLTREGISSTQYAGEILKLTGPLQNPSERIPRSSARTSENRLPQYTGTGASSACPDRIMPHRIRLPAGNTPDSFRFSGKYAGGRQHPGHVFLSGIRSQKAVYQELLRCPVVCVCRKDHPLAKEKQLTIHQLRSAGHMAVCRPPACPPDLFSIQRKIVTEHDPNQIVFCDNLEILYTMTASGFTFAVMTQLPGFTIRN